MTIPRFAGLLAGAALAPAALAAPASAAVPHTVSAGETLWSIASANGMSPSAVAAYNGISESSLIRPGETLQIPAAGTATGYSGATSGYSGSSSGYSGSTATAGTSTAATGGAGRTIQPGDTLWAIANANGVTVGELAAANGMSVDGLLLPGQNLQVPASSGYSSGAGTTTTTATSSSGVPLGGVPSPYGELYLRSDAASAWNQMRDAAVNDYGEDIYPGGPLSAYRTYDQQAELYQQYLDGTGAPADPPGTSQHNLGIAVDLATPSMRSIVDAIGAPYGWAKTVAPSEWWHVSYGG